MVRAKNGFRYISLLIGLLAASCAGLQESEEKDAAEVVRTVITAGIRQTKTVLDGGKVYWTSGDRIAVNGVVSSPLEIDGGRSKEAVFVFDGIIRSPLAAIYPASMYKDEKTMTLPQEQAYEESSFHSDASPMIAYAEEGASLTFGHPCAVLEIALKSGGHSHAVSYLEFSGNDAEQVCGDFTVDHDACTLIPTGSNKDNRKVRMYIDKVLSSAETKAYLVVPAGEYPKGFSVTVVDEMGHFMKLSTSARTVEKGTMYKMSAREFIPTGTLMESEIKDQKEPCNVSGKVLDANGAPLSGVVVSDGLLSCVTDSDGEFRMDSDLTKVKFISVSIPDGYKAPVKNALPIFYKRISDLTSVSGTYRNIEFRLDKMSGSSAALVFVADPQPRSRAAGWDKIAYHSLDLADELYADMKTHVSTLGKEAFGIVLGDIVHENMNLYQNYVNSISGLNLPLYNVIGNHDHNSSKSDDRAAAEDYEKWLGPLNYSFNLCGFHIVVVDDIVMSREEGAEKLNKYNTGLTDEILQWLEGDLNYVDRQTPIILCAHSQLFSTAKSSERWKSSNTVNGRTYAALLGQFDKVYSWAGHSHTAFNASGKGRTYSNIESHTIARCTGELWTNEWVCPDGVPRGYVVADLSAGKMTWKFKPMAEATSSHVSSNRPAYKWKDNPSSYDAQVRAYPKGAYGDNYVYANVFMHDDAWEAVKFVNTTTGVTVTMSEYETYDLAYKEINDFYSNVSPLKENLSDYGLMTNVYHIFRCESKDAKGSGYVQVTDRFGNTFKSKTISW